METEAHFSYRLVGGESCCDICAYITKYQESSSCGNHLLLTKEINMDAYQRELLGQRKDIRLYMQNFSFANLSSDWLA